MEAPKCPKCGTRHYSTQRCPADKKTAGPGGLEPSGSSGGIAARRKPVNHRPQPVGDVTAKAPDCGSLENEVGSLTGHTLKMEQARKILTNAERQKLFRKKHGDALREANRLRMAAKRSK